MNRRTFVRAAAATTTLPSLVGLTSGASVTATDHRVASFDGAELAVTVYLPDGDGAVDVRTGGVQSRRRDVAAGAGNGGRERVSRSRTALS